MKKNVAWIQTVCAVVLAAGTAVLAAPGDYQTLHEFIPSAQNGGRPVAPPIEQGGHLYGMTPYGGYTNAGVVYQLRLSDRHYTNLHAFGGSDGRHPFGSLLFHEGWLYGMTSLGGTNNDGVIFRMATNGSGYAVLHHFDSENENNGAVPWGSLIETNGILYGMTYNGGLTNRGVIFSIHADGTDYTNMHRFAGGAGDGKHPKGDLIVEDGILYGLANEGGYNDAGVVFRMAVDGLGYSNLYEFTSQPGNGCYPSGKLVKDGTSLFGTVGPASGNAGSVFYLSTAGGAATFIRPFTGAADDGSVPQGGLIRHDTKLYGVTRYGGAHSRGVLCSLGANYTNQYMWAEGGEPIGELLSVGSVFYGTTLRGGGGNSGTLFAFEPDATDGPASWCALTWVDDGGMGTTLAGDENTRRAYIRHSTAQGQPEQVFFGFGRTQNLDDDTWSWIPITGYGVVSEGADYEYTGRVARASPAQYYVAAKFIKGRHVYYNPPTIGDWGDWNTQLYTSNGWLVTALPAPSNVLARYVSTNRIDVQYDGDGTHWVVLFRKEGASADFVSPEDGVTYYQGTSYDGQGECVYRGGDHPVEDAGLPSHTVFQYRLYTENYSFYSTGVTASASTDPDRDDDSDHMPNQWEVDYGFNPGDGADGKLDEDEDHSLNWEEFFAGTDPTIGTSVFAVEAVPQAQPNPSVFSWNSQTGKSYTIWSMTSLASGARSALANHVPATPPVNTYTNPLPTGDFRLYFLEVEP